MIRYLPQRLTAIILLALMGAGGAMAQSVAVPPSQPALPMLPGSPPAIQLPPGPAATPVAPVMPALPTLSSVTPPPATSGAAVGKIPALPQTGKEMPALPLPKKASDTSTLPVKPDAAGDTTAPAPQAKPFSFGRSNVSVLFLPTQVGRMKEAISTYETLNANSKPKFVAPVETVVAAPVEKIKEPDNYPVFFLSSIAYNTPSDWSLWVSGHKITSRKNDTDVQVIAVSREGATFSWKPAYAEAIARRRQTKQFANTDAVKNKLAAGQHISQDDNTSVVTFSLKQNQTFTVSYFSIFEGYMEGAKLPAYTGTESNVVNFDTMPNGPGAMPPAPGMPGAPMPSGGPAGQSAPRLPSGNAAVNAATIEQAEKSLLGGVSMNGGGPPVPPSPPLPSAPVTPPGLTH